MCDLLWIQIRLKYSGQILGYNELKKGVQKI